MFFSNLIMHDHIFLFICVSSFQLGDQYTTSTVHFYFIIHFLRAKYKGLYKPVYVLPSVESYLTQLLHLVALEEHKIYFKVDLFYIEKIQILHKKE